MDGPAALRPLDEAAEATRRLDDYDSAAELAAAVRAVADAVERSLRTLLRSDPAAPDEHRLSARSEDFPLDTVVQSLRSRDRISLELAGGVHQLSAAAVRAHQGDTRPADADAALRVVDRLRSELSGMGAAEPPSSGASAAPRAAAAAGAGDAGDAGGAGDEPFVPPERRGRWMAYLGAALAAVLVLGLAWSVLSGGAPDYERGVTAFRAGRLDSAAVQFQRSLEDRPGNVSAMLYLARIYRRQGRSAEAAEVLRTAVDRAPDDADVRRELGHLFLDLRQPRAAVRQYERAVELEPEEGRNWTGMIRALRAAGDPRAERLLRDAPPEVQAALGRAPDTTDD